MTYTLHQILLE